MPAEYRATFDAEAARAHEAIVRRRPGRATHGEIWRQLSHRVVSICVVADDRPGLLSCITSALVESRIDVVSAHAYGRAREDGAIEAVDILWIRRLRGPNGRAPPIRARDIAAIAEAVDRGMVADATEPDSMAPLRPARLGRAERAATTGLGGGASARVRFETDAKDGSAILTVEAVDRPGLLLAVTQALFHAGLQIVGLRATTEHGRAVDRFAVAEADGRPLRPERRLSLQTAILCAIDEGTLAPGRSTG